MQHPSPPRLSRLSKLRQRIYFRGDGPLSSRQQALKVERIWGGSDAQNDGFTLLEIIVAIAILAILGSSAFRMISDGIVHTRRADKLMDATLLAQSLLARIGSDIALQHSDLTGETATGLHWRVRTEQYGDAADREQWPVAAYTIIAEVANDQRASLPLVSMKTLRLGPKEAAR